MATLNVSATTDYTLPANSGQVIGQDITAINFTGPGAEIATFSQTQFGFPNISENVFINGDASINTIRVVTTNGNAFSAVGWSFGVNWTNGVDQIQLLGNATDQQIQGSILND